ncbi:MAG: hypothetical protein IJO40_14175 [Thermoguttaceae bacterium]|nr:hypothetical protein [Thermoguttaceae bacterium]
MKINKKFTVAIEEIVVDEFVIEAESAEEALEIARAKYKSGEIVLCPGEVQSKMMAVAQPDDEATEWVEF